MGTRDADFSRRAGTRHRNRAESRLSAISTGKSSGHMLDGFMGMYYMCVYLEVFSMVCVIGVNLMKKGQALADESFRYRLYEWNLAAYYWI